MSPLIGLKTGACGEANLIGTDWKVLLAVLEDLEDVVDVALEEVEHDVSV